MSKIDTSELQKIITGRVVPHIYSFATNTLPNYLKVGDTYRPVEERLDEWRKHYTDLEEVSRHKAAIGEDVFFRDHAVHKYLQQKGIVRLPFNSSKNIHSSEFFDGAGEPDVSEAVKDIVKNYQKTDTYQYYNNTHEIVEYHHERRDGFAPRGNQQKVIDAFKVAVGNGRKNLLMYAVMRFGKSITSIWSAKSINAKLTVVVSAKADVRDEWKQTVESHKDFTGYRFLDKSDLKKGMTFNGLYGKKFKTGGGREEVCTNIVLFLTLQDLAGSGETIKNHHKILNSAEVDLLIVDETHFGVRAPVLGKILAGVEIDQEEKKSLKKDKEDEVLPGSLDKLEPIRAKITLHLSGTPYRILMGSEFKPEDIIATVQFSDIYDAKLQWSAKNIDKKEEWDNPYYGFPQMIRFAFNPNESSRKKLEGIAGSKPAHLFEPVSVNKSSNYTTFVHEKEVVDLLQVLDGTKHDSNMFDLLDNEIIKKGKLAQHIVVVLPFRASCDAFEKLVTKNKKLFKNISNYTIFNISGHNSKLGKVNEIKSAIKKAQLAGKKTITLTVNKMLTGTTVPQWDTMVYLKGTVSPQEYDQAIFRLQSPWVEVYKDKKGGVVKYDMKPQTLLVDLDPTRLFALQERKAFTYGVNAQRFGSENIKDSIEKELKISPIIALNAEGNKLVEVTATNIIDQVREYANHRTITEDVQEIGIDLSLKDNKAIFDVISKFAELGSKNGLTVKPSQEEGQEFDVTGLEPNQQPADNTPASTVGGNTDVAEDISSFEKRFRSCYALVLLFAFLSTTKENSLTDVVANIDANADNRRIARNLGLKKGELALISQNLNPFVRRVLDYKIENVDSRSDDVTITAAEHIDIAIHKFGRLSGAEVFTPGTIAGRMYDSLDRSFWRDVKRAKVLDIASKSGSFAKGFVDKALRHGARIEDIKDNFYSIPTSGAAYEFTRKMYQALGLNVDNIAQHFTSYDLLKLKGDEAHRLLLQGKKFCDITLADLQKPGKIANKSDMKFTAIVGNPPYQQSVEGNNRDAPIYNHFIDAAQQISDLVSLIHPARFLFDAGQTPKEWNKKMLNDPYLSIVHYEELSSKIFSNTDIKGGVCISLWNKKSNNGGLGGRFVHFPELESILRKVQTGGFEAIVYANTIPKKPLNPKRPGDRKIRTNAFSELPDIFKDKQDKNHDVEIIGLVSNVRTRRYISKSNLDDPVLNKWKVFISKSNGTGKFGEALSAPMIGEPNVGSTQSFIQIGSFTNKIEAENCLKYLKTKFLRALLSTLKVTQDNSRSVWKNVPLQDFTKKSDIDWSKSIAGIDRQLYKKYALNKGEINFIETHVKAMD